ncbi:hypothetical protein [Streptomyces sp. SID9727]|uniref:hypothetical protein n=1 Tax=Streptomyces sp. SID9727 TaxID=2706114 RepID=UPI0013C90A42|nr:hypothetical protein [Streptomyces sp. SID9727]NEC69166.1 hypothetical protein [Streptomyces sp. SID9727]
MQPPEFSALPALTGAESAFVDRYLDVLDQVGRINPAHGHDTYAALRAAQALASHAAELRDALALMHRRGETRIHSTTLTRALRALDGERRAARVTLPSAPPG